MSCQFHSVSRTANIQQQTTYLGKGVGLSTRYSRRRPRHEHGIVPQEHAVRERRIRRAVAHVKVYVTLVRQDAGVVKETFREEGVRRGVREIAVYHRVASTGDVRYKTQHCRHCVHALSYLIDKQRLP